MQDSDAHPELHKALAEWYQALGLLRATRKLSWRQGGKPFVRASDSRKIRKVRLSEKKVLTYEKQAL